MHNNFAKCSRSLLVKIYEQYSTKLQHANLKLALLTAIFGVNTRGDCGAQSCGKQKYSV